MEPSLGRAFATTIVSGLIAVTLIISTTVLLVSGVEVPVEFMPFAMAAGGVAIGASTKSANAFGG